MVSLYNRLTLAGSEGKRYVAKGWEKAGVAVVVSSPSLGWGLADPFEEIDNVL